MASPLSTSRAPVETTGIGIQGSFVVPMIAFAYVAFYGVYGYRAGRQTTAGPA